eukprot:gb/GECG01003063.1/.p1 GENE.gb/GECG01003063.1/~~gb/GECG01003063.1/.p1  ORF type:complete len:190 (+),score=32.11 gb/GECG01003063.1/:1-570(+)
MPTEDPSTGSQASTGQSEAPGQFDMEATQDLIIATMDPSVEDAKEAISRGANVNHKNEHGMSPLLIACGGIGPRQMLKELLQAGANVNIRDKEHWSPLLYAASVGQRPLVEELLDWNADLEARSTSGWTALTRASFRGNPAVVRLLLQTGANHKAETEGKTGRQWALQQGHHEVVNVFDTEKPSEREER